MIVKTLNLKENITICCAYFQSNMSIFNFESEINILLDFLSSFNNLLFLNAEARIWGGSADTSKGMVLLDRVNRVGLRILNDGSSTFTIKSASRCVESSLDLSFTNIDSNTCWDCNSGFVRGSHHHPIIIVL